MTVMTCRPSACMMSRWAAREMPAGTNKKPIRPIKNSASSSTHSSLIIFRLSRPYKRIVPMTAAGTEKALGKKEDRTVDTNKMPAKIANWTKIGAFFFG